MIEIKIIFSRVAKSSSHSIQASDRLMKEIKSIYKSNSYKDGNYTIEVVDDNIYEWTVQIVSV